jgi:hypothetical protein
LSLKYLREQSKERFILAHGFRQFSPLLRVRTYGDGWEYVVELLLHLMAVRKQREGRKRGEACSPVTN